ncbi:MAG: SDR family oxidoreductase [Clostridiales bacterium]|jgi:glucose 1-dehydrogenase|nr:SDR family oxidoreductase [Clostridiales bacterium]
MSVKKAFVTGGSRGIGRGIAWVLAKAGYDVAITYNSQKEEAQSLASEIEAMGRKCFYYQASMEQVDVPEAITAKAVEDLGGIDLLVCNAGLTRKHSLLTMTAEEIDFLYGLNYRSYLLCSKVAANYMVDNKIKGNIIFIASTRGIRSYPDDSIYGSLKAGLIRGVESLALEMSQYGIRVNCVAPGATAIRGNFTHEELSSSNVARKIPLGRFGTPKEVGYLVEFLASDKADYITGATIKIDGGLILPGMPEDNSEDAGYGWSRMRRTVW